MHNITFLSCSKCGAKLSPEKPQTVCSRDGGSLYVQYDLQRLKRKLKPSAFATREKTMWRYRELLPAVAPVSLGEGFTPLIPSRRLKNVWIKDEGLNPTGSFKARGLSAAVTMARAYGLRKLAIPSAGNAASALAAYCAAAGIEAHIFMPKDVPRANLVECEIYGAKINLIDGLIGDCAKALASRKDTEGWFDISTLKEPYRVEGKKTMGYEVAEQLGWKLPDAIIYPTGGGVGLIGMWKAFNEMEELGWLHQTKPKMICVQSTGCAPIPKAFHEGKQTSEAWLNAATLAAGLRVPKAYGDYIILDILHESKGAAVAVSDDEILQAVRDLGRDEGIFASPEGAASLAAYRRLRKSHFLSEKDIVVLFNTGSGMKYLDVVAPPSAPKENSPAGRNIGGIIGPF
jgi:threonine synthase